MQKTLNIRNGDVAFASWFVGHWVTPSFCVCLFWNLATNGWIHFKGLLSNRILSEKPTNVWNLFTFFFQKKYCTIHFQTKNGVEFFFGQGNAFGRKSRKKIFKLVFFPYWIPSSNKPEQWHKHMHGYHFILCQEKLSCTLFLMVMPCVEWLGYLPWPCRKGKCALGKVQPTNNRKPSFPHHL